MTATTGNTTPIYPGSIIHWRQRLTAQIVPRIPTTETPIKLGTAGTNGSLIHCIQVKPLGTNIATVVRIYSQVSGEANYHLILETTINAATASETAETGSITNIALPPILPTGSPANTGLHLAAGESLYCALGTAIAAGVHVIVRGGDY